MPNTDEIDLRDLFRVLYAGKWLIVGMTFSSSVIAIAIALMLPDIYRAEALLAPNDREASGGLSAMAAQYGGLASLAGVDLNGGSTEDITYGLEVLKSRKFISDFVARHDILVPLIAAKRWDANTGDLVIDSDDYDVESQQWVRKVRAPKKVVPSSQEAYEKFTEIVSVVQDKKTGFVTVSIDHVSPELAKQWVDWLISDLNTSIMRQDVAEAEQAITFLRNQIVNTSIYDLKNVFFRLIEEKTKIVMLAEVTDEYLLKTVDPSVVPEIRQSPDRILIVIMAAILGLIGGAVVVMFRKSYRRAQLG